jgi:hypothetical protein
MTSSRRRRPVRAKELRLSRKFTSRTNWSCDDGKKAIYDLRLALEPGQILDNNILLMFEVGARRSEIRRGKWMYQPVRRAAPPVDNGDSSSARRGENRPLKPFAGCECSLAKDRNFDLLLGRADCGECSKPSSHLRYGWTHTNRLSTPRRYRSCRRCRSHWAETS